MESSLSASHTRLKDFGQLVQRTPEAVKARAKAWAEKTRRPWVSVSSSQISQEEMARKIAARDPVTEGLTGILNAVEPCYSFSVCGRRQTRKIELRLETTIAHPEHFKTHRRPEGRPKEKKAWRSLRPGGGGSSAAR